MTSSEKMANDVIGSRPIIFEEYVGLFSSFQFLQDVCDVCVCGVTHTEVLIDFLLPLTNMCVTLTLL